MASKGRFVSVDSFFYLDPYVQKLAASEWPIYKYLLDGPERNPYGVYELSLRTAAFHTRYDETELLRVFDKFAADGKAFYVNDSWMVVKNHFKHNPITPRQEWLVKGWLQLLEYMPAKLRARLLDLNDPIYTPQADPASPKYLGAVENSHQSSLHLSSLHSSSLDPSARVGSTLANEGKKTDLKDLREEKAKLYGKRRMG